MSETSATADFNKSFNIKINFLAKSAFYFIPFIDNLANTANILLAEVFYLRIRVYTAGRQNPTA
jgi:hypothetical protein